ncbi:MAG: sulfatase-like hydrolase/transferase [bacterium]|nr:sulfatase-like hydrolase/transferase [bacterium]
MPRLLALLFLSTLAAAQGDRPNILWITSEDNGPHLGAYGDTYADTPHLDALAKGGVTYRRAWSNAPVCAPARTAIITGMYPTTTGSQHMRSSARLPRGIEMFPTLLRRAGYYCTNRSKQDYNLEKPSKVWDASNGKAHWRNRAENTPFFAVFNFTVTHESQIRKRPHKAVHDPAEVRVPAYHPDTDEVRQDWAQYYDKLTEMDARAGRVLAELEEDGLTGDTIVFYFGDHGAGMPRSKRWPYDSGLRVPLIVSIPERFRHLAPEGFEPGSRSERLVGFVDLAPTVLSLAGVEPPRAMQGGAFLGTHASDAARHLFGFRGRMDERYDLVRSITDGRFVYVRNFMPHRIYGQYLDYMFQTPTTRVWRALYDAGELTPEQAAFWEPKPTEELYDLESDPDEVHDLIGSPEHAATRNRLREALLEHLVRTRDLGFLPEAELKLQSEARTALELGADRSAYPLERILDHALLATERREDLASLRRMVDGLADEHPALRYWSAIGLLVRQSAGTPGGREVRAALEDPSAPVRILCAEALCRFGSDDDRRAALDVLIAAANVEENSLYTAVLALGSLDELDALAAPAADKIRALPRASKAVPGRFKNYVPRLLDAISRDLEPEPPALPERREVVYARRGDAELRLHVQAPLGDAPKGGRAAVVFFHGGGWRGGSPEQFFDQCEHVAKRGVVGISAEYRLTKKHGTTPFECVADGKAAVRWVRAHAAELGVDPARIAAGGGSAGGHVAAATATLTGFDDESDSPVSCRPDALVLFNPVFDNGPGGFGHAFAGERYTEFSPLHNVRARIPPSIVFLGTKDALIPAATAERFRDAVREVGGRCELHLYEGAPHGFFNRERSEAWYAQTMEAMDAFLQSLGYYE